MLYCELLNYILVLILFLRPAKAVVLPRHIDDRQFNVVWFMAEPLNSGSLNTDVSVRDLTFCRVVKPCTTKSEDPAPCEGDTEPAEDSDSKRQAKVKKQNACDCHRVLERNIKSFMDWVQSNKQMSIASIVVNFPQNPSNNKKCAKKKLFKMPMNKEMTSMAYHKKGNRFTNKYKIKKSQKRQVYPLKKDKNIVDIPVFELFNPEPRMVYNKLDDFNDYHFMNRRNAVTILKDDNNEDIYDDNGKNDVDTFDSKKVQSCQTPKMPNIFDLIKSNLEPPKIPEESFDILQMVTNTINQLISTENPNGFAVIIKGGKLEELADNASPLARSIGYVKCKTNENDTLILLSMLCPEERNINENGKTADNMLPVFCNGPHCKDLEEAEELKDIFDIVKRSLEESNCADKDLVPSEGRLARALIETVYYD